MHAMQRHSGERITLGLKDPLRLATPAFVLLTPCDFGTASVRAPRARAARRERSHRAPLVIAAADIASHPLKVAAPLPS